ncbi:unnamed protein product [Parnassius apollo]|uniref:(apollo) hypothetical protein n=1 Tax=Parnassius apollo TaxID=110799 RepID=A0A8S3WGC9_PARAO|nr:unnamed protein product [Parnassius apollo]
MSQKEEIKGKTRGTRNGPGKIERQLRKKNLVLFGVEEKKDSYFDLVDTVLEIIKEFMKITCEKQEIESVRRIGKIGSKNSPYYIMEDYPKKILEKRKHLKEDLAKEIEQGNNAVVRYDKIIILKDKKLLKQNNKRNLSVSPENSGTFNSPFTNNITQISKRNRTIKAFMATTKVKENMTKRVKDTMESTE